ncbi:MAG: hypothetical protein H7Z10_16065 [Gemmatimonadaceae bacterium]|nr:hypothetical protein [Acetobacteraceae bacterium]
MRRRVLLAALLSPLLMAQTAGPVFPAGSAVGIVPPPTMRPATGFVGFQDDSAGASILMAELPAGAYAAMKALDDSVYRQRQGLTIIRRQPLKVGGADALLLTGTQSANGIAYRKWVLMAGTPDLTAIVTMQVPETARTYSDRMADAALRSVAFRPAPTLQDKVGALPFTLGDAAGFRVSRTLAGVGAILTEGPLDIVQDAEQPMLIVVAEPQPPVPRDGRDAFAMRKLAAARLSDPVILQNETFTVRGDDWQVIEATGADSSTGRAHYVMQVLRYAPGGTIQALGVARIEAKDAVAPRFRRVALAVDPR